MKMKVRKRQSVLQVHGAHCEAKREDMDSSAPRFLMEGTGQGLQQKGGVGGRFSGWREVRSV